MTDKDINRIAEAIVNLIIKKQKAHDDEFKKDLESMLEGQDDISLGTVSQQDLIADELIKLEEARKEMIDVEDYTKAAEINNKIIALKNKYEL